MFELVKKIFRKKQEKSLVLRDGKGDPIFLVSYDDKRGEIDIKLERPLNLMVNGDICTVIGGECDFTSMGDMRIDTFLSNLFMNSYNSKMIRDLPVSIERQKEAEAIRQDNIKLLKQIEEEKDDDCTCHEKDE